MNKTQGRLFTLVKLLAPLVAIVAVVLALTWRPGTDQRAAADVPHAGLDFSVGVDIDSAPDADQSNDDCDTRPETTTPTAKCNIPAGTTFVLRVYLNNRGGVSYTGIDMYVTYVGVTSKDNPDNADWPSCGVPASFIQPGSVRWACVTGVGAPASTYTGPVGKTSFNCPSAGGSGTITVVHGASDTSISDGTGAHAEGEGTAESLAINCIVPPTSTPTVTSTNTPLPPTATQTRTPTNTATPTRTATATPLPSERADVNVNKTDLMDPVGPGGLITYRLVIRNKGAETATDVSVKDFLPTSVVFDSYSSSGATCVHISGSVQCVLTGDGDLAPGGEVTIDIMVIAPTPSEDLFIGNIAQVFATNEPFANQGNNQDAELTVVLAPRADLILEKTDKVDPVMTGANITYNLRVENIGLANADNVVIRDNLPDQANGQAAVFNDGASSPLCDAVDPPGVDPLGVLAEVDVQCNVGTLLPGVPVTFPIIVTAPTTKRDMVVKNIAIVSGDNELFLQVGNNLALQDTGVQAPPPDLSIDKQGSPSVLRAGYFSYTLTIRNDGQGDAFGVLVTDTLPKTKVMKGLNSYPQAVKFLSSIGAPCSPVGNEVRCTIAKLAGNGAQVVITLNVRAPTVLAQTQLTNQVTVSDPDEPEDPPGNNSDTVDTKIIPCFDTTFDVPVRKVRAADVSAVVVHYGLGVGESGYDILYDIDGSGRITGNDIVLVVQHYGEDC